MTAHRVAKDADLAGMDHEFLSDQCVKLIDNKAFHLIVFSPWCLGSIDIKTRTLTDIPVVAFCHTFATRRSIWCNQDQAKLCRQTLCMCLDGKGFFSTGQTCQIE